MPAYVATKVTRVLGDASAAARTIVASGDSANILGISVAFDGTADIVSIQDADGTAITDIAGGVDDTESITTPFIVDNGLLVVSGIANASTKITVFFRPDA